MDQRVAVVTGATRGIGRSVSEQLVAAGMHVVVAARDQRVTERVARDLAASGGQATGLAVDVADDASVVAFGHAVAERFGRWDVLVNNAGILPDDPSHPGVLEADIVDLRAACETNAFGAWRMARAAVPWMTAGGWGRIVNVSSGMAGLSEMEGRWPAYRMSKVALNALTRMLAAELEEGLIKVNSVCPGWVRTDMGGRGATRSPEEGAASVVWAVHIPEDGPTGGFFRDGDPIPW